MIRKFTKINHENRCISYKSLQITADHCKSLQITADHCKSWKLWMSRKSCKSLQITANHCRSLQIVKITQITKITAYHENHCILFCDLEDVRPLIFFIDNIFIVFFDKFSVNKSIYHDALEVKNDPLWLLMLYNKVIHQLLLTRFGILKKGYNKTLRPFFYYLVFQEKFKIYVTA